LAISQRENGNVGSVSVRSMSSSLLQISPVRLGSGEASLPGLQMSAFLLCSAWNLFQNEKCHLLVEHETQKLKALDESHNQNLKEWRDKLRPRKKVTMSGLVGLVVDSSPC